MNLIEFKPRRSKRLVTTEAKAKQNPANYSENKSQLIAFNFFQNLLKADEFSKSLAYTLIDAISIIDYNENEIISAIYNPIETVYFLITGSIASYEKIPKHIHLYTIPDNLINEGHVFGFECDFYEYTSLTLTKCTLGKISKDLFASLTNKHHKYNLKHELSFFFSLPYLRGIKRSNIGFLVANSQKLQIKKGDQLTIQGNACDAIYIVRQGQVKISYTHTINHRNDFDIDYFESISDILVDRFSGPRKHELLSSYNENRLYSIVIITNGDIIGDFELKFKAKNYYFNSKCELNNSIVYRFDIELFKRILLEKDYGQFKSNLIQKEELFVERLNTALKNTRKKQNKYALRILEKTPEVNERRLPPSISHGSLRNKVFIGKYKTNFSSSDLNKRNCENNINAIMRTNSHVFSAISRNSKRNSALFSNKTKIELSTLKRYKTILPLTLTINPSLKLFKTKMNSGRTNKLKELSKKIDEKKVNQILLLNEKKEKKSFSFGLELNKLIHGNNDSNVFSHKLNSFLMNKNIPHLFSKKKSNSKK